MKNKTIITSVGIIIFFCVIILIRSSLSNLVTKLGMFPKPTPVPTVKPFHPPLPQGRQVYNISQGSKSKGPSIRQVIIDPFDPKIGEAQSFWVKIVSTKETISVTAILYNDEDTVSQALNLTEGDAKDGVWVGTTTILNTHDSLYRLHIIAADGKDSSKVELSFR